MTKQHKTLLAFWSQFTYGQSAIPAYLSGHVPDKASYPYITFAVGNEAMFNSAILEAYIWVKKDSGVNANEIRASVLDDIEKAIPQQGTRLQYEGGYMILFPNTASFITYYDDPQDDRVLGGRISYEVRDYH